MQDRRTTLKQIIFLSAAAAIVPSCVQEKSKASVELKNISIDGDEEKMLADISETIIPKTDIPGAKDIAAHLFALKMVDDCFAKEDQQKFVSGMKAFEDFSKTKSGKTFSDADATAKDAIIKELDGKKDAKDDLSFFYGSMKRLTVQAYTTSKYYLTNIKHFSLIPGKFQGCVPVTKS